MLVHYFGRVTLDFSSIVILILSMFDQGIGMRTQDRMRSLPFSVGGVMKKLRRICTGGFGNRAWDILAKKAR
jgi:hypothetical protein